MGVSSCSGMPACAAASPICGESRPTTLSSPGSSLGDRDIRARDEAREVIGRGVRTRTTVPVAAARISDTGASAMIRPRPSTMMWSAVCAISLIRWEDRKTVRPSDGEVAGELAHPEHALGVEAVDRLVQDQGGRVAEQRCRDAEPLPHAERELAGAFLRDGLQPGHRDDLAHAFRADAVGRGHGQQVVVGRAAGVDCLRIEQHADLVQRGAMVRVALPLTVTVPALGRSRPTTIRIVVDLPAPFGPRNPVTRPGSIVQVMSSTAVLAPYRLVSP